MTTTLKPVDAVLVGFGWTGAIMGQQLCEAGLNVLALGARTVARHLHGFRDRFRAGRAALHVAAPSVSKRLGRHLDDPQQRESGGAADAPPGRLSARHRGRQRRRALERPDLAVPALGFSDQEPQPAALRQKVGHRLRSDRSGLGHHLRGAGALLRSVRQAVRHQRQGRQSERRDPARRQSLRGPARQRIPDAADDPNLCADPVRQGRRRTWAAIPSRIRPAISPSPIPTRWAPSSAPARTADSARNSAAATIPRRARRPPSCRL